eukprot:5201643-Pyramimonas_sp.AAC.1
MTANRNANVWSATSGRRATWRQRKPSTLTAEAGLHFLEMARISEGSKMAEWGRIALPTPYPKLA